MNGEPWTSFHKDIVCFSFSFLFWCFFMDGEPRKSFNKDLGCCCFCVLFFLMDGEPRMSFHKDQGCFVLFFLGRGAQDIHPYRHTPPELC